MYIYIIYWPLKRYISVGDYTAVKFVHSVMPVILFGIKLVIAGLYLFFWERSSKECTNKIVNANIKKYGVINYIGIEIDTVLIGVALSFTTIMMLLTNGIYLANMDVIKFLSLIAIFNAIIAYRFRYKWLSICLLICPAVILVLVMSLESSVLFYMDRLSATILNTAQFYDDLLHHINIIYFILAFIFAFPFMDKMRVIDRSVGCFKGDVRFNLFGKDVRLMFGTSLFVYSVIDSLFIVYEYFFWY